MHIAAAAANGKLIICLPLLPRQRRVIQAQRCRELCWLLLLLLLCMMMSFFVMVFAALLVHVVRFTVRLLRHLLFMGRQAAGAILARRAHKE